MRVKERFMYGTIDCGGILYSQILKPLNLTCTVFAFVSQLVDERYSTIKMQYLLVA